MSDLTATNCGCGCGGEDRCGNNNSCLWIILLLFCCGGFGNGHDNGCGCVTAVSGSSYYFSAAADLVMDGDVAIEILFAANLFCKTGQHAPSFFWKKLDCLAPFFLTKSFF